MKIKLSFRVIFIGSVILLSSCATVKHLTPIGGSKSDGIVKMSYEYGQLELPKVDIQEGARTAQKRCSAWGYSGAEAFGGGTKSCVAYSSSGCIRWSVTIEFQCTGGSIN